MTNIFGLNASRKFIHTKRIVIINSKFQRGLYLVKFQRIIYLVKGSEFDLYFFTFFRRWTN